MEENRVPLRVLIADDHRLFRQGLIGLMSTRPDLVQVVGEAASGNEAVSLAEQVRPDVVLMDIQMPNGDGLEATAQLRRTMPGLHVVMLTASESDDHLYHAVRLGAAGYLLKSLDAAELFDLLAGVARGEAAMTRAMAAHLLKGMATHAANSDAGEESLTHREIEVLRLIARGASNSTIADALCISINTVKVHLRNILEKLQLSNRTQVATYALHSGLAQDIQAFQPATTD